MYYITKKYIIPSKTNDTSYLVNCLDGVSLEKVFTFWDIGLSPSRPALETVYLSVNNKCNQSCFYHITSVIDLNHNVAILNMDYR